MLPEPFDHLPADALTELKCERGTHVFHRNDVTVGMFYLQWGEVRLVRHAFDGSEIVIHHAISEETFAEASLFSPTYHCDAVATADSILWRMDKHMTLQRLADDPKFSLGMTAHLAKQVQSNRRLLELRSIRSAEKRVLAALCEGLLIGEINRFANQIGLTKEATYRALSSLVKRGLVLKIGRGDYRTNRSE